MSSRAKLRPSVPGNRDDLADGVEGKKGPVTPLQTVGIISRPGYRGDERLSAGVESGPPHFFIWRYK